MINLSKTSKTLTIHKSTSRKRRYRITEADFWFFVIFHFYEMSVTQPGRRRSRPDARIVVGINPVPFFLSIRYVDAQLVMPVELCDRQHIARCTDERRKIVDSGFQTT